MKDKQDKKKIMNVLGPVIMIVCGADLSVLNVQQMKTFRKAMAKFPFVIRTEYAIRLLKEKNMGAAEKYKNIFNKVARKYPMKSDIESETEIMDHLASCTK